MDVARLGIAARPAGGRGGRPRRRVRGRVRDLRGGQLARAARHARPAGARLRGRAAGPDPARDADADPRPPHLRDRRAPARRPGCPSGSASAAAATASAASTASTGARPRATSSAGRRAASRSMGVGALLINCLPVDHVPGMLPWLRDFTDLPLGVYPNLGYLAGDRWRFDERIGPEEYAALALEWREEGAQIIGGCCGTTPEHIAAAAAALAGTKPGRRRSHEARSGRGQRGSGNGAAEAVGGRARPLPVPAALSGDHGRGGRLRPDAGQLPPVEAPVPHRHRRGCHVPRRRLRLRDPVRAARPQRRDARTRDRHRPERGRQHALERVP